MSHDIFSAGCTVYVWSFNKKGLYSSDTAVGHSSMKISDGEGNYKYLSFWPGEKDKGNSAPFGPGKNTAKNILDQLPEFRAWLPKLEEKLSSKAYDADEEHEGKKADFKFRFLSSAEGSPLDFAAMCQFAEDLVEGRTTASASSGAKPGEYHFYSQNCSHAVAYCFAAGKPESWGGPKPRLTGTFTNTWTPDDVKSYCVDLRAAVRNKFGNKASFSKGAGQDWQ